MTSRQHSGSRIECSVSRKVQDAKRDVPFCIIATYITREEKYILQKSGCFDGKGNDEVYARHKENERKYVRCFSTMQT